MLKTRKSNPFKMAPFILIGSYNTSFGGSAGREGTAVQMEAQAMISLIKLF
jgi:H+/Cl- antiporter ClcA